MTSDPPKQIKDESSDWDTLLSLAKRADSTALNALFSKLWVTLYPVIQYRLIGKRREEWEDVLQEVLLVFYMKIDVVQSNPLQYCMTILRHKVGDRYRKSNRDSAKFVKLVSDSPSDSPVIDIENIASQTSLDQQIEDDENIQFIVMTITELNPFCQTYFVGIIEGRGDKEVRKVLLKSEPKLDKATLRQRIHRCREALSEKLDKLYNIRLGLS